MALLGKMWTQGVLLGWVAATLVGCSDGSGKSPQQENVIYDRFSASCLYKSTDGELLPNSGGPSGPLFRFAAFDKIYDANLLMPLARLSAVSSLQFMTGTGVQVFGSPAKGKGCNFFGKLSTMPADLSERWNQATREDTNETRTMGLYLSKESDPGLPSLKQTSAIVVRLNAARWTLIHEYMHHLFNAEYANKGINLQSMRSELVAALKTIQNQPEEFSDSNSETRAYVSAWEFASSLFDRVNRAFPLEEVAIEDVLGRLYQEGKLQAVALEEAKNGQWYMRDRANYYLDRLIELLKKIEAISEKMRADGASYSAKKLQWVGERLLRRGLEVKKVIERHDSYRSFYEGRNSKIIGSEAVSNVQHVPCGHGIDSELEALFNELISP